MRRTAFYLVLAVAAIVWIVGSLAWLTLLIAGLRGPRE